MNSYINEELHCVFEAHLYPQKILHYCYCCMCEITLGDFYFYTAVYFGGKVVIYLKVIGCLFFIIKPGKKEAKLVA